jgi:hypothetical protein
MNDDVRWERVVTKLTADTEAGKIRWLSARPSDRENVLGWIYTADIEDKHLYLYEYQYRYYDDENRWEWVQEVAVELVSSTGVLEWRLPTKGRDAYDLLNVVRKQTAGAHEFADKYLGGVKSSD